MAEVGLADLLGDIYVRVSVPSNIALLYNPAVDPILIRLCGLPNSRRCVYTREINKRFR